MILFSLRCSAEHEFEGWFPNGAAFETQSAARKIACPQCGDKDITKAPMAPRLARSRADASPSPAQMREALQKLRHDIETNCDYVGERFPEEARRIHYGETERRAIYGEASAEEAEGLREEGIETCRIPWAPRSDA